jgi:hypothetical protein
MKVPI